MEIKKEDIERQLEHNIKAMSDPKVHKNSELKKAIEERIKILVQQLKELL